MTILPDHLPSTSLYSLQQDAPSLIQLYYAQPDLFMLCPSSPEYAKYHFEYNTNTTTRPRAILFPENTNQLVAAFKYCTSQDPPIPTTVRGGGHDYHGRNIVADAVQLDLCRMKWAKVSNAPLCSSSSQDPYVSVGPGTTAIEMQRELAKHGFATATGWVGSVGVIGWACGGGYGLEAGAWGLGVDNILGAKIITPGGTTVDTDIDSELLWAIRGAGLGNFGIISELRLRAYPAPRYLAGYIAFPLDEAEHVLSAFDQLSIPRNFSGEMVIAHSVMLIFTWISEAGQNIQEGWAYREVLKALGTVRFDTVAETTLLEHHEAMNENPAFNPTGFTTIHALAFPKLDATIINAIVRSPPPATSAILVHHAHGRATQPDSGTAWTNRDRHYLLTFVGFVAPDASDEQRVESETWSRGVYEACHGSGLSLAKSYWSLARPEHCNAVDFFGKDVVERLRGLRKKYNPRSALSSAVPVLD